MKYRNRTVDIIRGFAMLLVVLGHTISGSTIEYQDSFLFQVIWTLQMPLFIIISGYVTRYSQPISSGINLWKFVKKRTLAYLLPWTVWTFIVRGGIFNQTAFWDVKHLFWHMDSGYWFLFSIWTISLIYGISDYLSNKITLQKYKNILLHFLICSVGAIGLILLGKNIGFGFLCIKFTLYYIPFYLLGYLYGNLQDKLFVMKNAKVIMDRFSTIFFAIWLFLIIRYNFYTNADNSLFIIFRFCTSIIGCVAVISLLVNIPIREGKVFYWAGVHSLEIYLTHYLFLNIIATKEIPILLTLEGMVMLVINFVLTIGLSIIIIRLIQKNNTMNYLLYGKRFQPNV